MGIEDSDGTCTWNKSLGIFDYKPRYLLTLSFEKSSNPTNVYYEEILAFNMYFKRPQIPGF